MKEVKVEMTLMLDQADWSISPRYEELQTILMDAGESQWLADLLTARLEEELALTRLLLELRDN